MTKIALVTGSNRGIGLSISEKLHDDGFTVVGTYRTSAAKDAKFDSVRCDITISEDVESALPKLKRITDQCRYL